MLHEVLLEPPWVRSLFQDVPTCFFAHKYLQTAMCLGRLIKIILGSFMLVHHNLFTTLKANSMMLATE